MRRTTFLGTASAAALSGAFRSAAATAAPDAFAAIDAEARARLGRDEFAGVVSVADRGAIVFERAYGLASRAYGVPNTVRTRFNVGSIGKTFTQAATAGLVRAGRLSLDDTVGKHLPAYPNPTVRATVTVRQLLTMRSGVGDIFNERFEAADRSKLRSNASYLPLFADLPLLFAPGTDQRYSNGGYVVLGEVLAAAAGMPYEQLIQTAVFGPANMTRAGFFARDEIRADVATGYVRDPRKSNVYAGPAAGSAAGGSYASAADLHAFVAALTAGRIALRSTGPTAPAPVGLGVAGGAPGLNATLEAGVGNRYDVVVLANDSPPSAEDLTGFIRTALGFPPKPEPQDSRSTG